METRTVTALVVGSFVAMLVGSFLLESVGGEGGTAIGCLLVVAGVLGLFFTAAAFA